MKRKFEKIKIFFNNKYLSPIIKLLKQGTTPREIALGIAIASVLGVFPVLGSTTILITIFAIVLRLNLPLVQLINVSVYPLQLILLVPFMKLGEILFGFEKLNYSIGEITEMIAESIPEAISTLWNVTMQGIAAWAVIAPFISLIIFYALFPLIHKLRNNHNHQE